jgi:hypothetical protein
MGFDFDSTSIAIFWRVSGRKIVATEEAELISWTRASAGTSLEYRGSRSIQTNHLDAVQG